MRATAPVRSGIPTRRKVNQVNGAIEEEPTQVLAVQELESLAEMTVDERLNVAKENHVCFSCLKRAGRDHRHANWKEMKERKQCTRFENGIQCRKSHHPLLHKSATANISLASVTSERDSMLPVIAASICGPNGLYKRGNVLLDSGAQISLIKSETAENLGLNGRDVSVNIVKVGGEKERFAQRATGFQ